MAPIRGGHFPCILSKKTANTGDRAHPEARACTESVAMAVGPRLLVTSRHCWPAQARAGMQWLGLLACSGKGRRSGAGIAGPSTRTLGVQFRVREFNVLLQAINLLAGPVAKGGYRCQGSR